MTDKPNFVLIPDDAPPPARSAPVGTGGANAGASGRLRDLLSAVAVYAVGGEKLLQERAHDLPGAIPLLEHLGQRR